MRLIEGHAKAMELRRDGLTYRQIAVALGVSTRTAFDYVQAELVDIRNRTTLDVEAIRDLELERCDVLLKGLGPGIRAGDPPSVAAAVSVMGRRAKLLGLDAPVRAEWVGALTAVSPMEAAKMSDSDIESRVKQLMDRVAGAASTPVPAEDPIEGD